MKTELTNKATDIIIDNTNVIADLKRDALKNKNGNLTGIFKKACPSGRQTSTRQGLVDAGLVYMIGHKMYPTVILLQMDAHDIHKIAISIYYNFQKG